MTGLNSNFSYSCGMDFDENGIPKPKRRGPRGCGRKKSINGEFVGGFVRSGAKTVSPFRYDPPEAKDGVMVQTPEKALKERKVALSCLGVPASVLEVGSPAYARTMRLSASYKRARQKEIYQAHGFVSAGVASLLVSASLALSASRFLYEAAAQSPINPEERHQAGMAQLLKLASSLSDSARQNELAAWDLAAREAQVRKRNDNANVIAPWITVSDQPKAGRPKKVNALPEAGYVLTEEGTVTVNA